MTLLEEIPREPYREGSIPVLETKRLALRAARLEDAKAVAALANDRRIAVMTRRLPHPYTQDHAIEFVRATANDPRETVFLIEKDFVPVGMVGLRDVTRLQRHPERLSVGLGF